MSQTRRVILHALVIGAVAVLGFVFSQMPMLGASPSLSHAAVLASLAVAIGFAVQLVAILRTPGVAVAEAAGSAPSRNWRVWGLAVWVVICLAAATSEFFAATPEGAQRYLSPFSTLMLVGLVAWQALRTVKMEQRLQRS